MMPSQILLQGLELTGFLERHCKLNLKRIS